MAIASAQDGSFAEARNLYYLGIYGNKEAAGKADTLFAALHKRSPGDALVMVYYGSLRLLEAQHTWALWKKNALSKEGIRLMDAAVAAQPKQLEIRFVRGATERELPGFFGRKQQAKADIAAIINDPSLTQLEPRLAAASYYDYGLDCEEAGRKADATAAWRKAVSIAPDSHAGQLAAKKVKALP